MTLSEEMLNANLSGYSEMLKKLDLKLGDIAISLTEISKASSKAKNGFATLLESFKAFEGVSKGFDTVSKAMGKTSDATKPLQQTFNSISEMSVKMRQGFNSVAVDMKNVFSNTSEINDMAKSLNGFGEQANKTVTGIKSVSEAGKSLSGAFSISAISGYLSIVAAIIPIIQMIAESIKNLSDPMYGVSEAISQQVDAYEELSIAQSQSALSSISQGNYYEGLAEELKNYSEQANHTKEEIDRMRFVVDELNSALGSNIELTKDGTLKNFENGDSIDQLIKKKTALAMLDKLEADYIDAFSAHEGTKQDLYKANNELITKQNELTELQNQLLDGKVLRSEEDINAINASIYAKEKEVGVAKNNYEALKLVYESQTSTIENYTQLQTDILSGNYDAANELITNISGTILTASNASVEELTAQAEALNAVYKDTLQNSKGYNDQYKEDVKNSMLYSTEELLTALMSQTEITTGTLTETLQTLGLTAEESTAIVTNTLYELGIDGSNISAEDARMIADGLADGFGICMEQKIPDFKQASYVPGKVFENINEIKSPSKVFARLGENLVAGLNVGVEDMTPETEEAMKGISGAVTSAFDGVALPQLKGEFQSEAISNALAKIAGLFGFSAAPRLNIKKLAVGGLVEPGQLFLAREAGPELVGSYGSHTAVMNNNQIVESVSNGVYAAQREQNALLREQNNLLRAILNNDSSAKVYLDGKQITATVEKYQRERGVQLVSANLGYKY